LIFNVHAVLVLIVEKQLSKFQASLFMAKRLKIRSTSKTAPTPARRGKQPSARQRTRKASQREQTSDTLSQFRLTHPDRIVFADLGLTKRNLAEYYVEIADWILPQISGRPLSLVRCPSGAAGSCFFQKHPPAGLSESVERIEVREKSGLSEYLVVNNLAGLIALVQFGALELHVWGSRADDIEHPDRLVIDLDPDPAVSWKRVIEGAYRVRDALQELDLVSFVKTTGGKGLHVVVPIVRKHSWEDVKEFTQALAEWIAAAAPDRYVANMSKAARRGKIFVDYLRNQRGATSVAAYSTRARPGATVSMPVHWAELKSLKSPAEFNVQNVQAHLAKPRRDPWAKMPGIRQLISIAAQRKLRLQ
jgi:bifunctional non-homologous end joining protein LigD